MKTSGYGYDPLIQFVTDKEYAKVYIAATVGKNYVIETYRIIRNREQLKDFVPDRVPCIMKPTHSSGQVLIYTDATTPLDRQTLCRWFDINYYERSREQNYRYLIPKIIVEEYISEDGYSIPKDYKVFCFKGVPRFVQVDGDRFSGHTRNLYDTDWNRIHAQYVYSNRQFDDPKPILLGKMMEVSEALSANFCYARIDMYATKTKFRVGALSFFAESASGLLEPPEAEYALGKFFAKFER